MRAIRRLVRRVGYTARCALGEVLYDLAHRVHPDWTYERAHGGVVTGREHGAGGEPPK